VVESTIQHEVKPSACMSARAILHVQHSQPCYNYYFLHFFFVTTVYLFFKPVLSFMFCRAYANSSWFSSNYDVLDIAVRH